MVDKFTYRKTLATALLAGCTVFGVRAGWGKMAEVGTLIDKADMFGVEMAPASDGSTYLVWTRLQRSADKDGFSLHAQLLDPQGNKMWGEDGIVVDNHNTPTWYSHWNIIVTKSDELVISWADARSEEGEVTDGYYQAQNPVLYKLDKTGKMLWGEEGVVLDPEGYRYPAKLFQVEDNIYARCYPRLDSDPMQLMLLDEFGESAWKDGKDFSGQIIASEGDNFIAVYATSEGVMAMRYNKDMRQRWKAPALISEKLYGGYDLNPYTLRSDGKGGVAVCYLTALGDFGHMPLVAYVTGEGETAFSEDVADTEDGDHCYPVMNINPETETIMTIWQMNAGYGNYSVQGAQMDYFGDRQWGDVGKPLVMKQTNAFSFGPIAVESLKGGEWLICYADEFGYENCQLVLARIDAEGNMTHASKIGNQGSVNHPVVTLRDNIAEIIWVDNRDTVDENGMDVQCKSIKGVRVDINSLPAGDGVEDVIEESDASAVEYYSVSGLRLEKPVKGINIVRKADGTVSKLMVK